MRMLKKIIITAALIAIVLPAFSEEINLTPKNSYSGFNNTGTRSKYPQLQKTVSASDIVEEQNSIMKSKSVREMGSVNLKNDGSTPMTYSQFPQNYDSSNTMMMMQDVQNGMQNMFMGY